MDQELENNLNQDGNNNTSTASGSSIVISVSGGSVFAFGTGTVPTTYFLETINFAGSSQNVRDGVDMRGTSGNDSILSFNTNDTTGHTYNDQLWGLNGDDSLNGGDGDDTLNGGAGRDSMQGEEGNDTYILGVGDGVATDNGGGIQEELNEGFDTIRIVGIDPDDLRIWRDSTSFLSFGLPDGTDGYGEQRVYTPEQADGCDFWDRYEQVVFDDGTVWDETTGFTAIGLDTNQQMDGTDRGDRIEGRGGDDSLNGGDGDDILNGGAGLDSMQGEAGDDTAVFSGSFFDYDIMQNSSNWTITDEHSGSPDGTDTLTDVEFAQFADLTIDLRNPLPLSGRNDLDGTGFSDIVFQMAAFGNFAGVSGGDGSQIANYFLSTDQRVIAIEDIDNYAGVDVLFTVPAFGTVAGTNSHFWIDSVTGAINNVGLNQLDIVSVNDFDGDGSVEFLARSKAFDVLKVFETDLSSSLNLGLAGFDLLAVGELDTVNAGEELLMVNTGNGAMFTVSGSTGAVLDPFILSTNNLTFQGLADITGDGVDEIVMERNFNGAQEVYNTSSTLVSSFGIQDLEAIGDFNGDGIDDFIFDRGTTYVVTGGDKSFYTGIATATGTVVGVGNYDGSQDGSEDLLFLNGAGELVSVDGQTAGTLTNYARVEDMVIQNDLFNTGVDLNDGDALLA